MYTMGVGYSRVAVTGASSFIGARLCELLSAQGIEVHAITLDGSVPVSLREQSNVTVHTADVTQADVLTRVLIEIKPEVIFHLAAYGTLTLERTIDAMMQVNGMGTHNVLQAGIAAECNAFVYAASIKEYAPSRSLITEETPIQPWDEYAVSKAVGEMMGRLIANRSSVSVTSLRLCPVYGPGEHPSRFVPTAIDAATHGKIFTNAVGTLIRNFIFVDDAARAFIAASEHRAPGFRVYNIGSEQAYSFNEIILAIEHAVGKKIHQIDSSSSALTDDSWVVSSAKAQQELRWQATIDIAEGIRRTVASSITEPHLQTRVSTVINSSLASDHTNER